MMLEDTMRTILCEKIRIGMSKHIAEDSSIQVNANIRIDKLTNDFIAAIDAYITGARLHTQEHYIFTPATWWQKFKETYFPLWAKKRFPVITEKIRVLEVRQYLLLPHIPPDMDKEKYYAVYVASQWQGEQNA